MDMSNAAAGTDTLPRRTAARAALVAVAAPVVAAVGYLATNQWFGAGDLSGLTIWSLPLGALTFVSFRPVVARLRGARTSWRYVALVTLGSVLGIGWTVASALLLGGWLMAFSFPAPFYWPAAGLLAGIAAAWLPARRSWPVAFVLALAVLAGLLRLHAYAQMPPPRARVVMAQGTTSDDINDFWQKVIGRPGAHPGEFDLLGGIAGAGVTDYEGKRPVFTVSFRKRLGSEELEALLARIRSSPLVDRVEIIPDSDRSGVHISVNY